ncbi:benzoate 4-monooxygenase cytochrome P450 [Purpureocillium lavendulum]|uniref:Benzoate 4-monooxygenase cytochrome P450 n=1 Tax=Purpureocillium lavendulum TaxID=1247861 RepID=A0AB34FSX2_9HYPO|nr:benzoate 4-monooxygenase cytochrome P450 [Purpureocillium lavendulum]
MSKLETGLVDENSDEGVALTASHRDYLLRRHGTVELDPVPSPSDDDPLNWPRPKKDLNLLFVAFHSFIGLFTASAIQCTFVTIAEDLGRSVQDASYLVSVFIAILGVAPLIWQPLSRVYGRRPVFLASLLFSLVGNVACAVVHNYSAMVFFRAFTAFFISPALALGSGVVGETFFKNERGRYMGVWAMMTTLGVPVGPLVFGFVAVRVGYRWIYWTLAITNGVQLIVYGLLGSETRYVHDPAIKRPGSMVQRLFWLRRVDPSRLTWYDFVHPLTLVTNPNVTIAAVTYAMIFLWGCVMTTLMVPQIYPQIWGFNAEKVGLQYIAFIVGTVIGELAGGFASDHWMRLAPKREGSPPKPEFRLWLSYVGYLLTICGVVVFLVQLGAASDTWDVSPDVGMAIGGAGNQVVTTVMITYAVDCLPQDGAAVGTFVIFVRHIWGFIGPFWFPQMINTLGFARSTAVPVAMIVGVSMLAKPNPLVLRRHRPGDIGHIISRHGAIYCEDYGWDERFEAMVARIMADFLDRYDPQTECGWIAERDGEFLGCVFLVKDHDLDQTARIRALLVEHGARGLGLGGRLVQNCIDFAREAGYKDMVLYTNSILTPARKLYKTFGFRLVDEAEITTFAPGTLGETWKMAL